MKIGIVFGSFIPLHAGHISLIHYAFKENDKIIIAVCGSSNDRGKDLIPFKDRIKLMKFFMRARFPSMLDKVVFSYIDDEKVGLTGLYDKSSWEKWARELWKNTYTFSSGKLRNMYNPNDEWNKDNCEYTWYTGEKAYAESLREIYPEHEVTLVSRKCVPISGTEIRKDLNAHLSDINPIFVGYLLAKGKIQ